MSWDRYTTWEEAEMAWDQRAREAKSKKPLRGLKVLPDIPGITPETAKHLKWKSLNYMVRHDPDRKILRHFLKHPLRYTFRYLCSVFKRRSFKREGDFFFYGFSSLNAFEKAIQKKDVLLVVGFSYCQKPHECPSGRFTDKCLHDETSPICQQCDIGKALHALPKERVIPLIIPTVHYIGDQIFQLVHGHRDKEILFLITACEMTLEMFGDYGNMAGVKGVGVRLDGRICNTMRAFELSERGIKPGLTLVTPPTQQTLLSLIKTLRKS